MSTRKASRGNRKRRGYMASTASSRGKHTLKNRSPRLSGPPIRQIPGAPEYVNEAFRTIQVGKYKKKKDQPFDWGKVREAIGIMNNWEAGISSTSGSDMSLYSISPSPRQSSFSGSDMSLDSPHQPIMARRITPNLSPGERARRRYRPAVMRRVNDPDAENRPPPRVVNDENRPPPRAVNDENIRPNRLRTRTSLPSVESPSQFLTGLSLPEEHKRMDAMYGDTMGDEGNKLTPIGLEVLRGPMGAIFAGTEERKRLEKRARDGKKTPKRLEYGGKRRKTKKRNKRKYLVKKKKTRRKRKKTRRKRKKTKKKGGALFEATYAAHSLASDMTN